VTETGIRASLLTTASGTVVVPHHVYTAATCCLAWAVAPLPVQTLLPCASPGCFCYHASVVSVHASAADDVNISRSISQHMQV
jgi:hypothetical protein